MRTILFFTDAHVGAHASEFAGACERALALGWRVVEIEYARTSRRAEEFINHWKPDGLIVECSHLSEKIKFADYGHLPCVFIDPGVDKATAKKLFIVKQDAAALAEAAYAELSSLAPASYGFVGWAAAQTWSNERERAFARLAKKERGVCFVFPERWTRADLFKFHNDLSAWIATLPKPAAICAANDETAEQVAISCAQLNLRVPEDVAIIGADNEALRCEIISPTLSTVAIDYIGCGHGSIRLLEKQFRLGAKARPETALYGVASTIRRDSTRLLPSADPLVRTMLSRIARDACAGLSSAEVLAELPCSRRHAEQRFHAAVGHSIGEEIFQIRFSKVLQLLPDTRIPIAQIAAECGWESDSFLKRTFKKHMGQTMRNWRKNLRHFPPCAESAECSIIKNINTNLRSCHYGRKA